MDAAAMLIDVRTIPTRRWLSLRVPRLCNNNYAAVQRTSWTHGHHIITHSSRLFHRRAEIGGGVYVWLFRRNCLRHVFHQDTAWRLSTSLLDLRNEFVMVPVITTSFSTSRCSPRWRPDESAKTAVSRPKKLVPTVVSCAHARSRLPTGRSSRRGRCSRWSSRRSARTPASAYPTLSPVVPDYRRTKNVNDVVEKLSFIRTHTHTHTH